MKKKKLIIIVFCMALMVGLIALALAVYPYVRADNGQLTVLNRTTYQIYDAQVVVCRQTLNFRAIKPSESKTMRFVADCDGDYDTTVTLSNGQILKVKLGYVTGGMPFDDIISVEPNGLKIEVRIR
jgi:hypothetical protein